MSRLTKDQFLSEPPTRGPKAPRLPAGPLPSGGVAGSARRAARDYLERKRREKSSVDGVVELWDLSAAGVCRLGGGHVP